MLCYFFCVQSRLEIVMWLLTRYPNQHGIKNKLRKFRLSKVLTDFRPLHLSLYLSLSFLHYTPSSLNNMLSILNMNVINVSVNVTVKESENILILIKLLKVSATNRNAFLLFKSRIVKHYFRQTNE